MFSDLNTELNLFLNNFDIYKISPYMTSLKVILLAYLTMLITFRGYQIIAGKTSAPVKDFIYEMFLWMIIVTVAFNSSQWWSMISDAIEGVNTWAGGGKNLYAVMDSLSKKVSTLATLLYNKDPSNFVPAEGLVAEGLVWAGFLLAAVGITFILIGTTFTLKLLILVAPLAIASLLFGWFKNIFQQWLTLLVSNTIVVLLIGLILKAISTTYTSYINKAIKNTKDIDIIYTSVSIFIFGLFIYYITKNVLSFSSALAGGGADAEASGNASAMGGAAASAVKKAGQKAGKSIGGLAKKGAVKLGSKALSTFRKGK